MWRQTDEKWLPCPPRRCPFLIVPPLALPGSKFQRSNTRPHGVARVKGIEVSAHQLNEMAIPKLRDSGNHSAQGSLRRVPFILPHGGHGHFDQRHPIRGASWETLVREDPLRREALAHTHALPHFWRTAGGAETDLLLERSGALHAVEIKTARATSPYLTRGLRAIMEDTGAITATVIDQGQGVDPLAPGVTRRGFTADTGWLSAA